MPTWEVRQRSTAAAAVYAFVSRPSEKNKHKTLRVQKKIRRT